MSWHIADVHVVQPLGVGNRLGPLQGWNGRDGQILQKIFGMKLREVHGHIRAQVGLHPSRQPLELGVAVVEGGHY